MFIKFFYSKTRSIFFNLYFETLEAGGSIEKKDYEARFPKKPIGNFYFLILNTNKYQCAEVVIRKKNSSLCWLSIEGKPISEKMVAAWRLMEEKEVQEWRESLANNFIEP